MAERPDRPLAGRRIVVTRAVRQAAALASELAAEGADVVHLPLVEIVEPADGGAALAAALDHLDRYEWIVVTSPNGAARVAPALAAGGHVPKLAAVGQATAAALGVPADLVARRSSGAGLVAELPAGHGTLLLAQGDRAGSAVADGLRALGWDVDAVVAYRTVTVRPDQPAIAAAATADAVVFLSGSAVEGWVDALGAATPPVVIVIGPSTERVARSLSVQVTAVSADQSTGSLVSALKTALGGR